MQNVNIFISNVVLLLVAGASLQAADVARYEIQHLEGVKEKGYGETLFGEGADQLREGQFDPLAQELFDASKRFTQGVFQLPILELSKAITRRDPIGDVIVSRWRWKGPAGEGTLVFQDTPFVSLYAFHLEKAQITNKEEVNSLLSNLLVWDAPPNWIRKKLEETSREKALPFLIDLSFPVLLGTRGGILESVSGRLSPVETDVFSQCNLHGDRASDGWYVTFSIGKDKTAHPEEEFKPFNYPVPAYVPERFPPLSELMPRWNKARLRAELDRVLTPPYQDGLSKYRNSLLIRELVRRGLADEEVMDLLRNAPPHRLYERGSSLLGALITTYGIQTALQRYFKPALQVYESLGPRWENLVELLFHVLARQGCSPVLETEAIRLLSEARYENTTASYLGRCSTSTEALRMINAAALPESIKSNAVFMLRRRLDAKANEEAPVR